MPTRQSALAALLTNAFIFAIGATGRIATEGEEISLEHAANAAKIATSSSWTGAPRG